MKRNIQDVLDFVAFSTKKISYFLKQILSFFLPFTLKSYVASFHGKLIVRLVEGRKVLDTEKNNYSYGSLQRILKRGLSEVKFDTGIETVLVLGLGGGSIVETIRKDFGSPAHLTLVDIDPLIIKIATEEFKVTRFPDVHIIESDAIEYLEKTRTCFDLIIVDLFIADVVPLIFTEEKFLMSVAEHLNPKGKIIYNMMRRTMPQSKYREMQETLTKIGLSVRGIEKVCISNNLIFAEKK